MLNIESYCFRTGVYPRKKLLIINTRHKEVHPDDFIIDESLITFKEVFNSNTCFITSMPRNSMYPTRPKTGFLKIRG